MLVDERNRILDGKRFDLSAKDVIELLFERRKTRSFFT
jgi:hypothetical protein